MCHKEKFAKETKEDVNLVTLDKKSLHSPLAAEVLASGEEMLAYFQGNLELLTHRVPCKIWEMNQEEEEDSSASKLEEEQPSLLLAVGGTIFLVGGTLVFCQEVPTYQLIQGMHTHSSSVVLVDLI